VSEAEQIADRFIAEISDGWGEDVERKDKERLAELISAAMDAKDAEILALRAELAEALKERDALRTELDEMEGVAAVWRRRTNEAEAELAEARRDAGQFSYLLHRVAHMLHECGLRDEIWAALEGET